MGVAIRTTYSAVISPTSAPGIVVPHFGSAPTPIEATVALMIEAIEIVAWLLDNVPKTRIAADEYNGLVRLVATFADETDATAFKTRWG